MLYVLDGCNYSYYNQVPSNTTCNIAEGGSAYFKCDVTGICNTFCVLWFKHKNGGSITTNSSEHIFEIDGSSSKYQILITDPVPGADGHCNFGTTLIINRFNHSDNGYYWCQILSNNNCLLQPSPRAYAAVGEIMNQPLCNFYHLFPTRFCAEDATSQMSEKMGCISESISLNSMVKIMPTVIDPYSTHTYNTNSTTTARVDRTTTSMVTLHDNTDFDREDNMVWVYGLVTVFLLVIIILILSLVIVSIKYRTQQKPSKHIA